ncbi:hypothetical protein VPNG_05061 [Cytospora leucostoma]|uniref:Uncharacterized protein n=1 Tax=Cytospora leucostoma TaxID=1230097 RepID=A0A423X4T2_9PEZI|nr:hypothetical protein VPNG_05061 [Cytospora leucostoma]
MNILAIKGYNPRRLMPQRITVSFTITIASIVILPISTSVPTRRYHGVLRAQHRCHADMPSEATTKG